MAPVVWALACAGGDPGGDSDKDGLTDAEERALGTDPHAPDSDHDGQSDGLEVKRFHTNPLNPDSDGDGAYDGEELFTRKTDPNVPDAPSAGKPMLVDGVEVTVPIYKQLVAADAPLPPEWRCESKSASPGCFVYLQGGTFMMGAQATDPSAPGFDPAARPEEGPVHPVTVTPFRLQRYEASASQFDVCVIAGWCRPEDVGGGALSTWKVAERAGAPINYLSFEGARRLCSFVGARLPSEAEWEFAARGVEGRRFSSGDTPDCGVAPADPSLAGTAAACELGGPVVAGRLRSPTPDGLYALSGNVVEWVADVWAADAYARPAAAPLEGPSGAATRVQRGGGWTSAELLDLRAASRGAMHPDQQMPDVGVRCARSVVNDAP